VETLGDVPQSFTDSGTRYCWQ